ncbi:MAG: response regulator [Desulfobacteraceae bacterium]|nr:response regulator [Desulfobacteraceae bacterium]
MITLSPAEKQVVEHPAIVKSILLALVPVISAFAVMTSINGRYLASGLLAVELIFFLVILFSFRRPLADETRIYIYRNVFRTQIILLGAYLVFVVGVQHRLEVSPWSFIFIFLLSLWLPNRFGGAIAVFFNLLLWGLMFWPDPSVFQENRDYLIRFLIALATLSMLALSTVSIRKAYLEKLFQAREKLKASEKKYKEQSRQLTAEIQQRDRVEKRLHHAIKMETVGKVAAGVAHDLNNTLSAIVTYPDMILMDMAQDHRLRKPLTTIRKSGLRAAAIVEDLLALSRRGVAKAIAMDLRQIVEDYIHSPEFMQLKDEHPSINLIPVLNNHPMVVKGSPIHISKTLMNLVVNAAEAMPDGGTIQVKVDIRNIEAPVKLRVDVQGVDVIPQGEYVSLSVIDTGTGIAPDDLESIFEPFYTRKVMGRSGTGLGMALVLGVVNDHNGYIQMDSQQQKGTCVNLYFPKSDDPIDETFTETNISDLSGSNEKILVVDDEPDQRMLAEKLLKRMGYTVYTCSSGEDSIAFLNDKPVDLVIMDILMAPGMDGVAAAQEIRSRLPDQPILFMTGFSEADRLDLARKLGKGPCLLKPYTLESIGKSVQERLKSSSLSYP